jgi:hypothetical protein
MKRLLITGLLTVSTAIAPLSFSQLAQAQQIYEPTAKTELSENNTLTVHLVNNTGSPIVYQAIGDTELRVLQPDESAHLLDLNLELSLIFHYQNIEKDADGNFKLIKVELNPTPEQLEISLNATMKRDEFSRTVFVNQDGEVYIF